MPQFTERVALKEIVKFAKRDYKQKRPRNVKVLRVKDEKVFSKGGPIPSITVKESQIPYYIVALDYGDMYRLYHFKKDGTLTSGENVEKTSDKMKGLEKSTKLEYRIPKSNLATTKK
jgi:hypothetical protein